MIFHDEVTREYKVYVPQEYSPDTPMLMLNFHGGDMVAGTNHRGHEGACRCRRVYTIIPKVASLKVSKLNMPLPSPTNKSDADDFGFIAAMLDAESERLNIDTDRVYTGYSNGRVLPKDWLVS